jgi:hypothetical protein
MMMYEYKKDGIIADFDECFIHKRLFRLLNLDVFLPSFLYASAKFLGYLHEYGERVTSLSMYYFYWFTEVKARKQKILDGIEKRFKWYIVKDRWNLLSELSKNGSYDVILISSYPKDIVIKFIEEWEKRYEEKINANVEVVIGSALEKKKKIESLSKHYDRLILLSCEPYEID